MMRDDAAAYIRGNFQPDDRLAVVLINKRNSSVIQRISTAEQIATLKFQQWLHGRNGEGYDVYISMNALRAEAQGRRKEDIGAIRHVYLDLDHNGNAAIQAIFQRRDLPVPSYVLNTSPGKWQVTWIVKDFDKDHAEHLQRGLARETGADPAATDACRVLRIPYFFNHKYGRPHLVRAEAHSAIAGHVYTPADFPRVPERIQSLSSEMVTYTKRQPGQLSQSERDWAYAKRALARGQSPGQIAAEIEAFRCDKHNPQYYAELTVRKAARSLEIDQAQAPARSPSR